MNKQIPVPHPRSFDTARGRRAGRIAGALLAMVLAAAPAFAGSSPTGAASAWTDASREQAMERLHAVDQALHERIRVFHATPAGAAAQAALEASTFAAASEIDPSIPFKIARLEALQGDLAAREAQWRALAPTLEPLSEQLREVDRRVEALESVQAAQAREDAALAALRGSLTSMGAYLPGEAADWTHEDLLPPVGVDLRLSHGQTYSEETLTLMEAAQQARNDRNALVRAERERLSPDYSQRLQELSAKTMALRKTEVEIATLVQERQMLDATVREVEARLSDNDAVRAADARFIDALCAHDPEARAIIAEREAVVRRLQALDAASNR